MGVFDYNNSGDNVLFYDVIMQAIFESRLMDYKDDYPEIAEYSICFINVMIVYVPLQIFKRIYILICVQLFLPIGWAI